MSEVTIEALEHQRDQLKLFVERGERIKRLFNNADFRELVLEHFCTKDCSRYAHESADPSLTAEQRADALAIAQAGGHFKRYFAIQLQFAQTAQKDLPDVEESLDEIRREASEEDAN